VFLKRKVFFFLLSVFDWLIKMKYFGYGFPGSLCIPVCVLQKAFFKGAGWSAALFE